MALWHQCCHRNWHKTISFTSSKCFNVCCDIDLDAQYLRELDAALAVWSPQAGDDSVQPPAMPAMWFGDDLCGLVAATHITIPREYLQRFVSKAPRIAFIQLLLIWFWLAGISIATYSKDDMGPALEAVLEAMLGFDKASLMSWLNHSTSNIVNAMSSLHIVLNFRSTLWLKMPAETIRVARAKASPREGHVLRGVPYATRCVRCARNGDAEPCISSAFDNGCTCCDRSHIGRGKCSHSKVRVPVVLSRLRR